MQRTIAAGVMLAGLGVLVGVAIGAGGTTHLAAQRVPPVEVRTEVIRKTVNVYRREHPHHATGTGSGGGVTSAVAPSTTALAGRTRASGGTSSVSGAPVVSTRTSGAGGGSTSAPRTRSSGARGGEGDSGGGGRDD